MSKPMSIRMCMRTSMYMSLRQGPTARARVKHCAMQGKECKCKGEVYFGRRYGEGKMSHKDLTFDEMLKYKYVLDMH